ncbi:MAG: succinyl-diaminopimelate desuccinylase [Alphaproteobacteria bacterium]|nr:succinyl-diaminopimelate desuccinylase [Alphaproteobacteria bacterium]
MAKTALELCRALVQCPSVTPEEGSALTVLQGELEAAGFTVERVRFSEPGTPDVDNLYARIGSEAPYLIFAGHTDVVPVGDAAKWRFEPFSGAIADEALWGRGAADMKGGVAAFTAAACAYVAQNGTPNGSIGFLITGDEEGPSINGTQKLLAWTQEKCVRFDACLVGEPTSREVLGDMVKIGRRGSLNATLIVEGRQGHAAYPALADNPIPKLLRLLDTLTAASLDAGTEQFDSSNLEIVSVDTGNKAFNIIPAKVQARFNVRFNDLWTPEMLSAELRRRLTTAGLPFTLNVESCNAVAFRTEPGPFTTLVAEAIQRKTGRVPKLSTTGGTSDARFIQAYCPVVEFGLVGTTAHHVDEHIAIRDLDGLAEIYRAILDAYFCKK